MMLKIPELKISELYILLMSGVIILVAGFWFLYWTCNLENLPTFFVAVVALGFSYLSYYNSKERFRLDLFEKRFESYQHCLRICSTIVTYANIPDIKNNQEERRKFDESVNNSIRGLGYHSTQFLFGPDIRLLYKEIHTMCCYFESKPEDSLKNIVESEFEKMVNTKLKYAERADNIVDEMPNLFSKYLDMSKYIQK